MNLIVDAHEDMAWNGLTLGRDYSRSALETRAAEAGGPPVQCNGNSTLGLPEYLRGQVAVIFGTLFASPAANRTAPCETKGYSDPEEAHALYAEQIDYYQRLTDEHEQFRLISTRADLEAVLATWQGTDEGARRIGIVPLMEGADGIREPAEAAWWQERGVRLVGLAWSGTRYAGGTGAPGPLTPEGRRLVSVLSDLGLILDLAHSSDESYLEALDRFEGTVVCSHANARALMKGFSRPERLLSDDMIRRLAEAGGVIGVVPYNRFLRADVDASAGREAVTLSDVVAHIDYICQLTGSAAHAGIGSDFDGGFGVERIPLELDTIADLQMLDGALTARGYSAPDVQAILGGNWLGVLRRGLPT
jgi:membrane dipeptidase